MAFTYTGLEVRGVLLRPLIISDNCTERNFLLRLCGLLVSGWRFLNSEVLVVTDVVLVLLSF